MFGFSFHTPSYRISFGIEFPCLFSLLLSLHNFWKKKTCSIIYYFYFFIASRSVFSQFLSHSARVNSVWILSDGQLSGTNSSPYHTVATPIIVYVISVYISYLNSFSYLIKIRCLVIIMSNFFMYLVLGV